MCNLENYNYHEAFLKQNFLFILKNYSPRNLPTMEYASTEFFIHFQPYTVSIISEWHQTTLIDKHCYFPYNASSNHKNIIQFAYNIHMHWYLCVQANSYALVLVCEATSYTIIKYVCRTKVIITTVMTKLITWWN